MNIKYFITAVLILPVCLYAHSADKYPNRIISLGPNITENIYLLGAQDKLVADTVYCNRPEDAKNKEKIGTIMDVNIEKILSLQPDVVLAISLTRADQVQKMKKMGLKIISFPEFKNFDELCSHFGEISKIVNKEETAKNILNETVQKVNRIKEKAKGLLKPKVFIQIGAKPLFTATGSSFINDFLEYAGGTNIAKNAKSGLYSREEVVRSNPDVIIIVLMGIEAKQEKENWENYKTLNAVKNNRVYTIDAYKVCSPTPVNFAQALQEIALILHPEEFLDH